MDLIHYDIYILVGFCPFFLEIKVCVCESVICFHLLWYDQGLQCFELGGIDLKCGWPAYQSWCSWFSSLWWGFVSKGEIWCWRGLFSKVIPKPIVFINQILLYSNLILNWGFTLYIVATTKYNSQIRKRNCSLIKIYKNTNFLIPIIHKRHEQPLKLTILLPSCNHHITHSKLKNNCT